MTQPARTARPKRSLLPGVLISVVILLAVPATRETIAEWLGIGLGFTAGVLIALLVLGSFGLRKR